MIVQESVMAKISLPFVLMRGGTSKGVFLRAGDVPTDREALSTLVLDMFGSPDKRQIDGLGGADKLTSKVAVIGPPSIADADVDYLFGQVGVVHAEVDYNLNCGNLSAAVGMYAIQEGFVAAVEGSTLVRIHNLNTRRIIHAHVPVRDGEPLSVGDLHIGGVPGTGAPIALDFSRAVGAITGKLLPLESATTIIDVEGSPPLEVSVVDGANLVVYAKASAFGLRGNEHPAEIDADPALRTRLDAVRRAVAYRVGLRDYWDTRRAPSTPFLVLVSPPMDSTLFTTGETVAASSIDLVCRQFASESTAKTLAATVTATTGIACRIVGSVPHRLLQADVDSRVELRFAHPSGVINVRSAVSAADGTVQVVQALIHRTARRIAEGTVHLRSAPVA
jgi:2-methylaconitate cis-trans-isomerase PrpF